MLHTTTTTTCLFLTFIVFIASVQGFFQPGKFKGVLNELLDARLKNLDDNDMMSVGYTPAEPHYFEQVVDHFDPGNPGTFQQLFYYNDTFFKPNGPVFLMMGGEGPLSPGYVAGNAFTINKFAEQYNAMVVALEHRFYGTSMPATSTSSENLKLLSVSQALEDTADFVAFFNQTYLAESPKSQWITIGGSYSGNLAAWFRLKFPQLAVGALSSSAPVQAQLNFTRYNQVTTEALVYWGGEACKESARNATLTIEGKLFGGESAELFEDFNICNNITSANDYSNVAETIAGPLQGPIQYNNQGVFGPFNASSICENYLLNDAEYDTPYDAYAQLFNDFYEELYDYSSGECVDASYDTMVQQLRNTSLADTAARAWTWQTCTTFGYYQTGSGVFEGANITLQYFLDTCNDVFGESYVPQNLGQWIERTNIQFGSKNFDGTNVVFTTSQLDQWSALGVEYLETLNPSISATNLNSTSHCQDMFLDIPPVLASQLDYAQQVQSLELGEFLATAPRG